MKVAGNRQRTGPPGARVRRDRVTDGTVPIPRRHRCNRHQVEALARSPRASSRRVDRKRYPSR